MTNETIAFEELSHEHKCVIYVLGVASDYGIPLQFKLTPSSLDYYQRIRKEIDDWLFMPTKKDLYMAAQAVLIPPEELKTFSTVN